VGVAARARPSPASSGGRPAGSALPVEAAHARTAGFGWWGTGGADDVDVVGHGERGARSVP
jgi:hypothetical protein